ncbi:MAG: hypothetical protein E7107_06440 [Prevotella sp.]|nr:hypothetical protein [Prevotella sp.]
MGLEIVKTNILKSLSGIVIALMTLCSFVFFQYFYPYHFFYQEQNQLFLLSWEYISTYFDKPGCVARLVGDFLTQFYYYLYAGATILNVCLLLTVIILYRALCNFKLKRLPRLLLTFLLFAFLVVCHFDVSYRLSSTISIMGWMMVLWLVSLLNKVYKGGSWVACTPLMAVALLPAYFLFGLPQIKKLQGPDFILEKNFAIENEYYFGYYDKVVDLVKNSKGWNDQMLFFYNLVQAQRGDLPDHLLDFTPNYLGTFEKIGPKTPLLTIINMNELYWALGDMTFTERAAMMANVFSPDNRNNRMVKRLAECALVSGDSVAAGKFLGLMEQTFVWRGWARNAPSAVYYAEKARFNNRQDTVSTSDNAHFIMMQLLDSNPDNEVALDYILCSTLLLKDIENFKRDYDRYCTQRPRLKKLYQEALCIWLAGSNASEEEWHRYVKQRDVMQRFVQYNQQRGSTAFSDTYWYYFDKVKAPEI